MLSVYSQGRLPRFLLDAVNLTLEIRYQNLGKGLSSQEFGAHDYRCKLRAWGSGGHGVRHEYARGLARPWLGHTMGRLADKYAHRPGGDT